MVHAGVGLCLFLFQALMVQPITPCGPVSLFPPCAGSETTSAYLTVQQMEDDMSAVCVVHNSCRLEGIQLTVHIGNMKNTAPILTEQDKLSLEQFGKPNKVDFVALSFTRSAQDVQDARAYLDK
jgi:pyruvate kinase